MKKSQRKVVVLASLAAMLSLVSALLLAWAPPPLTAESTNSLFATEHGPFLDEIFKTAVPTKTSQWKYIYVHQSATPSGNAINLAKPGTGFSDHFLVGNGDGSQDGEIQIGARWNNQEPPTAFPGVDQIDPTCISICVVGDFDHSMPTPTQIRRLSQLVSTLQSQLRIPADRVVMLNEPATPSSVGRYFPVTAFRDQILP